MRPRKKNEDDSDCPPDYILLKAGDLELNFRFRVEGGVLANLDTILMKSRI